MFKRVSKRMSALIIAFTLTFMSIPFAAHAANDDIIKIVHTNDMHGRIAEKVNANDDTFAYTRLAGLKYYAENNDIDLILDAGDAIQGLPISNISKGKYMIEAMKEVGYTAMTIGNHEFDFGQNNLYGLRKDYANDGTFHILSNNTQKKDDNTYPFERFILVEKKSQKIGIIGVTTPETLTKSHPKNTEGLIFNDPYTEIEKDLKDLEGKVQLIVILAHLGQDGTTKLDERCDILADTLSSKNFEVPILVIDGHSHTKVPQGKMYGNQVFYVQTGDYLNNLGHVEINLENFSQSTAKLVDMESLDINDGTELILEAEKVAQAKYGEIANEMIIENFPFDMTSNGLYARTQEIALGNMIADAMMLYGQDFDQKPDLAVINGGGIRNDLNAGKVTNGDIISILPFGNMYSSIKVTGKELIEMFEHSVRSEVQVSEEGVYIQNEDGTYLLERNGGFLQVSGASFTYNPFHKPGNKIINLMIGDEPVDSSKSYILATNDFLAAGGDGYTMLGGERVEGEGLEQIFINF